MESTLTNTGYSVNELERVQSEYAFDMETPPAVPNTSEYQLPSLNPWKTLIHYRPYHHIQSEELPPPVHGSRIRRGNSTSLRVLKEHLNNMDDGVCEAVIVDGVLYFVSSEAVPSTGRNGASSPHMETDADPSTAREDNDFTIVQGNWRTDEVVQTQYEKETSDIAISISQLKKFLDPEIFREVLQKYKKEYSGVQHSFDRPSTQTEVSAEGKPTVPMYPAACGSHTEEGNSSELVSAGNFRTKDERTALDHTTESELDVALHSMVAEALEKLDPDAPDG